MKKERIIIIINMSFILIIVFILGYSSTAVMVSEYQNINKEQYIKLSNISSTLWYNQPSSEYYCGIYNRTYFSYLSSNATVCIKYYDHTLNNLSDVIIVDNWTSLDDHSAPVINIIKNGQNKGKIQLYYAHHNSPLYMRESILSENINRWTPRKVIDDGKCSYPSIVNTRDNLLLIFYRKIIELNKESIIYKKSLNDGESWNNGTILVNFGNNTSVYKCPVISHDNLIYISWSVSYKNRQDLIDIFFAYSDNSGISWKNHKTMENITLPFDNVNSERIYVSEKGINTRVWDIKLDRNYEPLIAFINYYKDCQFLVNNKSLTKKRLLDSTAFTTHFDGEKWVSEYVTNTGFKYYPSGIVIDSNNTSRIYISAYNTKGILEIEEFIYDPIILHKWIHSRNITKSSQSDQYQPQMITNYHDNLKLTWNEGNDYYSLSNFSSSLNIGFINN